MNTVDPTSINEKPPKENSAGIGLKAAVYTILLLTSVISGISAMLSAPVSDAYNTGRFIGGVMFPFIFCGIVVALFSIAKSMRQQGTRYRIAMAVSLLLLVSQSLSLLRSISKQRKDEKVAVTAPVAATLTPKDMETVRAKALAFEDGIGKRDISVFQSMFDNDALLARAADGLTVSPRFMAGVKDGMQKNGALASLLRSLMAQIDEGTVSYDFLRVKREENTAKALFRVRLDGGINYHEWIFQKNQLGTLSIVDVFIFLSGALLSETVRQSTLIPIATDFNSPEAKATVEVLKSFKKISAFARQKAYGEAQTAYKALSEAQQNHKMMLMLYINVAQNLGDEAYLAAMERFIRNYPDDPGQTITSLDFYIMKKDFEKAHAGIDKLDALVNDPYLNTLRSNLFAMNGEYDKAERAASAAMSGGVNSSDTYWALLNSLVYQKKYKEALTVAKTIFEKFEETINPKIEVPQFQEFIKTKSYRAWMKAITPKGAPPAGKNA